MTGRRVSEIARVTGTPKPTSVTDPVHALNLLKGDVVQYTAKIGDEFRYRTGRIVRVEKRTVRVQNNDGIFTVPRNRILTVTREDVTA